LIRNYWYGSGTKLENIVLKEPGSVPPFELY
jgi:hypothetical protein